MCVWRGGRWGRMGGWPYICVWVSAAALQWKRTAETRPNAWESQRSRIYTESMCRANDSAAHGACSERLRLRYKSGRNGIAAYIIFHVFTRIESSFWMNTIAIHRALCCIGIYTHPSWSSSLSSPLSLLPHMIYTYKIHSLSIWSTIELHCSLQRIWLFGGGRVCDIFICTSGS